MSIRIGESFMPLKRAIYRQLSPTCAFCAFCGYRAFETGCRQLSPFCAFCAFCGYPGYRG